MGFHAYYVSVDAFPTWKISDLFPTLKTFFIPTLCQPKFGIWESSSGLLSSPLIRKDCRSQHMPSATLELPYCLQCFYRNMTDWTCKLDIGKWLHWINEKQIGTQSPRPALCELRRDGQVTNPLMSVDWTLKANTRINEDEERLFAHLQHSGITMGETVPFALTNRDVHTEKIILFRNISSPLFVKFFFQL